MFTYYVLINTAGHEKYAAADGNGLRKEMTTRSQHLSREDEKGSWADWADRAGPWTGRDIIQFVGFNQRLEF